MANLALYELAAEYREAADRLADTDLDEQTIADTLEGMAGDLQAKAQNVAFVIRNLESMAAQIKEAEIKMEVRRKSVEARAARVRQYLLDNMELAGMTKIESPYFTMAVRENPASVVIDAAGQIPCEYYAYPEAPPPHPDKKLIAKAIKDGFVVNGAHLARSKRLDIR